MLRKPPSPQGEGIQNTEVKHLKKLIKSRRGVAIELAIGVMFLMMAFTIMLLSTAGLQNDHRVDDYQSFKEKIEIDNIGEYVVANRSQYINFPNTRRLIQEENIPEGYYALYSENQLKIYRGYRGNDVVLTIGMEGDKITSWKYLKNSNSNDSNENDELYDIGEYVVSKYKTDYPIGTNDKGIMIDGTNDTGYTVTVIDIGSGTFVPQFEIKNTDGDVVLTIIASENGKIISWK